MSVQAIENWALVKGIVTGVVPDEDNVVFTLSVEGVTKDDGYPNLFEWAVGQSINETLPKSSSAPTIGTEIEWRMRIVGPGQAMPDPSHF